LCGQVDWLGLPTLASASHHHINLIVSVSEPGSYLLGAAVLLQQVEPEGSVLFRLVDVSHGAQQRAQNNLCVILEEVDLNGSVAEVHDDGPGGSEPSV